VLGAVDVAYVLILGLVVVVVPEFAHIHVLVALKAVVMMRRLS
jgi:hypothetical protein